MQSVILFLCRISCAPCHLDCESLNVFCFKRRYVRLKEASYALLEFWISMIKGNQKTVILYIIKHLFHSLHAVFDIGYIPRENQLLLFCGSSKII